MKHKVKVCVSRTDGTNCDNETKHAFQLVGADAEIVHIKSLIKGYDPVLAKKVSLLDYDIWAIPGGFSHGDYIASGRVHAEDLKHFLGEQVNKFVASGKPIIGICNGFQVLVKYGLLPRFDTIEPPKQTTTLTYNDSGKFECRWVHLAKPKQDGEKCIWTKGIERIDLPVAHGEGKFVAPDDLCKKLFLESQVVFQYVDNDGNPTQNHPENPNGSMYAIAGICDSSGLIFGLMPHPERYNHPLNHPLAQLQKARGELPERGLGLKIFENGVKYFG
ncbi:phosphoribosylformylglycinamidine synthase I [Candidatus Pacearchaeota archaeon]|nr:phosphoribosylformylglycinamidine synthase I [Candidatus Pacearchaeota archaeon]